MGCSEQNVGNTTGMDCMEETRGASVHLILYTTSYSLGQGLARSIKRLVCRHSWPGCISCVVSARHALTTVQGRGMAPPDCQKELFIAKEAKSGTSVVFEASARLPPFAPSAGIWRAVWRYPVRWIAQ